ncbi:uncharacterized protein LOC144902852 isoform X2 [Branchiostoma floridae x Branchiostoma belcheri]
MASMTRQWRLLAVLLYIVHLHTALTCPDVCTCTSGNAVVNCNGKALETVPQNIPTTVTFLMLRDNDISQLSNGSFSGLSLLYSLNLQSNKIRHIPNGVFVPSIHFLFLKENNISDISSGAFENLVNLRELYLDKNALTNIQYGTFTGLVDLQTLSLSFNAINSVSNDSFTGLTNLRTLYLQNNYITTIPTGPFKRSPNIVTLYLHNNPLRCDCVLYELVQWFNKDGRYLGDIYEELTCAFSPFPELVGLSVTDAASQMTTCVQTTSPKPGTSSTPSPPTQAITQPSSKTMTAKSTTSSTLTNRNTTTTTTATPIAPSKSTTMKAISELPPKTSPPSNASVAIDIQRSTIPTTTHSAVRSTIVKQGNVTVSEAAITEALHSVAVRGTVTPKPLSTIGTQTVLNLDDRQPVLPNTTRATTSKSNTSPRISSSLQDVTTTPHPKMTSIARTSKLNLTTADKTTHKYSTGRDTTIQNSTILQIFSTPSKTETSTQSYLTTKNLATTKRNTTAGRVTTKGTTEQDSTMQNSTISQVTSTLQEATTKTTPFVTSRAGTSTQNTTTAQKTTPNTTDSSGVVPSEERTIPVTEHLIGIQDVTVGETVTIRCDAASPSKNVTYRWSVDGKQDPDYRGQILRYIPLRNGSHRIQCTAHTDEGDGVSDIITLFVKLAEAQTMASLNETTATTTTTNTVSISQSSTAKTTPKSTTNQTTPFWSTKMSTSQAHSTSRQVSTSKTTENTTTSTTTTAAAVQNTTVGINVTLPKPDILIEDAGEDSTVPGNGSNPDGPPVIRVTEHIIGIQDITVGETVTVRCDTEGLPTVCVKYRWTVDGEVVDGQNGQTLRYTPQTDGPHKIQCTAISNGIDGISDAITVFAMPKGKKLDVITRCEKDPHSGVSWDNIVKSCDLHMHELAEIPVTYANAPDVAGKLRNITSSNNNLTVDDLGDVRMVFENVANASSQPEVGYSLLETVDLIMDADDGVLQSSQKLDGSPSKIVKAMEENNDRIDLTNGKFSHLGKNFGVEVFQMTSSELSGGVVFALLDDGTDTLNNETVRTYIGEEKASMPTKDVVASIALPDQLEPTSDDVRLSFTIFQNSRLFPYDQTVDVERGFHPQTVNSKVIAGRISGLQTKNLSKPVTLKYLPVDRRNMTNMTCVFWDFAANHGGGAWSTDGCSYGGMDKGRVVCECDHLTNFAVLMQHTIHKNEFAGLVAVSKVLCGLMVIGLAITLLTHVAFDELRQHRSQIILMNICVALLATLVGFLLGIGWTENDSSCRAVAFFLHYFLLAFFVWTAVEAYNMYLAFDKTIADTMKRFIIKSALAGWGIPFAIVLITLVSDVRGYRSDNFCWLEGFQLLIGFMLPAAVVLCFNAVTYFVIVRKLRQPDAPKDGKLHDNVTKKKINIVIIITILVGLQWIFGFFLIRDAELAVACVFFVLNSLQGLFIFLFRCVLQEDVRSSWRTCCDRDHTTTPDGTVTASLLEKPTSPPGSNDPEKGEKPPIEDEEAVPLVSP